MAWNVVDKYKLDMSGTVDNAAALEQLASDIAALVSARKPLPKLVFSEGLLAFSKWPNLAHSHLQLVADGMCCLVHTGTGDAITFDGLHTPEQGIWNLVFDGFVVAPNMKSANGLVLTSVHTCYIKAKVSGAGAPVNGVRNSAYVTNWCVMPEFDSPQVTIWDPLPEWPQVSANINGMWIDGITVAQAKGNQYAGPTTSAIIKNASIQNVACGIVINSGNSNLFHNGACQSCTVIGIQINDHCGYNKFFNFDLETNVADFATTSHAHSNVLVDSSSPFALKCHMSGWNNHLWNFSPLDGVFGM